MNPTPAAPVNPKTEVTRAGIAKMAGCSICKVGFVTTRDNWAFPKPCRPGPLGKLVYSRAAVIAWLKINNLAAMVFTRENRSPVKHYKKQEPTTDSAAFAQLKIGLPRKPIKSSGKAKRIRVHVKANDDYQAPDPRLTKFSNNAEHRYVGGDF